MTKFGGDLSTMVRPFVNTPPHVLKHAKISVDEGILESIRLLAV